MSTALSDVRPTRRSIVRGAAWSVPVVAVAATAPAFAASLAKAGLTSLGTPVKWGNGTDPKHISWDVALTNSSALAISNVTLTFAYRRANLDPYEGLTFVIRNIAPSANTTAWTAPVVSTGGGTATSSNSGAIPPGGVITIHTDFSGNDNSTGDVKVDAVITYVGGTTSTASIGIVSVIQATGSGEPLPHRNH